MSAMKSVLLLVLCAAVHAAVQPPLSLYHEAEGIPAMQRIQQHEQALQNGRISQGVQVPRGTHPYLGGLIIHLVNGRMSMCGASLLSNTKAVTAAHCWWDGRHQAHNFTIVYGSDRLTVGGVRFVTNTVEIHVDFNPVTTRNNIAIITHSRVEYNEYINRILVPRERIPGTLENVWAVAVGYGRTTNDPSVGQLLDKREVRQQVLSYLMCATRWSSQVLSPGTMCTGSTGGLSVCGGDAGGPLVIGVGDARTLIGIASFGMDAACGLGWPAGFTRVDFYAAWINARI